MIWLALALIACWALVLRACWWEWNLNPQYSYGVLVPILSVLLLARRWPDRPEPKALGHLAKIAAVTALFVAALVLATVESVES